MEKLEQIKRMHKQAPPMSEYGLNTYQIGELIRMVENQEKEVNEYLNRLQKSHERISKLEKGLNQIIEYEERGKSIPEIDSYIQVIAKQVLEGE